MNSMCFMEQTRQILVKKWKKKARKRLRLESTSWTMKATIQVKSSKTMMISKNSYVSKPINCIRIVHNIFYSWTWWKSRQIRQRNDRWLIFGSIKYFWRCWWSWGCGWYWFWRDSALQFRYITTPCMCLLRSPWACRSGQMYALRLQQMVLQW